MSIEFKEDTVRGSDDTDNTIIALDLLEEEKEKEEEKSYKGPGMNFFDTLKNAKTKHFIIALPKDSKRAWLNTLKDSFGADNVYVKLLYPLYLKRSVFGEPEMLEKDIKEALWLEKALSFDDRRAFDETHIKHSEAIKLCEEYVSEKLEYLMKSFGDKVWVELSTNDAEYQAVIPTMKSCVYSYQG